MRNLSLGNALVRILTECGTKVYSVTYPGDVGTHVAKCLWYLENHQLTPPPQKKGQWLGEIYAKADELLEEQKGTPQESVNRTQLTQILTELHNQQGPFFEKWRTTRKWSIDLMKTVYDWADVKFDRWFWESEMDAPSLKFARRLHSDGKLVKDQGAIGMDLQKEGLGFCLIVKSDGTGLYATKDIQLAKIKFEEFGIEKNIYIVDERQSHHFKQVFKVLEKIGFPQAKNCFHLPYSTVELPSGAMSSRKGNIVPLEELIHNMEEKIKQKYLADSPDRDKLAAQIANGAIKYGMLRMDTNRKIIFDINEWLRLDGETGPYLQYAHARITTLCQKFSFDPNTPVNWDSLEKESEKNLLFKTLFFTSTLEKSVQNLQTMPLCTYLYELAKLFNGFYSDCSIQNAPTPDLQHARLSLSFATGRLLNKGLELLGIFAPAQNVKFEA